MSLFDWLRKLLFRGEAKQVSQQPPIAAETPASSSSATPPSPVPRRHTLDLNAGDFLPIDRDELKEAAKDVRRGGAWFGRRDLIPPADDPRTKLIDRALVTQGLLAPEQLTEIHQVGAEMDRVRPAVEMLESQAFAAGEAAVQAERERRAELKKRKKEEAAERKRQRAKAIAQRRANDILFLGRGVSGRLGERLSEDAKLADLGLPLLSTPAEVAAALGLTIPRLRWLAFHTEVATRVHYVSFTVPKKSGGTRTLSAAPHLGRRTTLDSDEYPRSAPRRGAGPRLSSGTRHPQQRPAARRPNCCRQSRLTRLLPQHHLSAPSQRVSSPRILSRRRHYFRSAL